MISKELLGEVLKADIRKINNSILDGNLYYYKTFVKCKSKINIYELAHKCKEWALSKGYIINSGATTSNDWSSTIYKVIKENPYIKELSNTWEQSENEAIFRACQWILDNKKEGN